MLETIEDLGFCAKGEGGALRPRRRASRRPHGRLPFNTDGGGLCNNHPANRGGMTKVIEAVRQLRGEAHPEVQVPDCALALAHGTGGVLGTRMGSATRHPRPGGRMSDDDRPTARRLRRRAVVNPGDPAVLGRHGRGPAAAAALRRLRRVDLVPAGICPAAGPRRRRGSRPRAGDEVYSFTVIRRGQGAYRDAGPYVLAYVELEEGPRIMTNIVGSDPGAVRIGQRVEVVFDDTGAGSALPRFRPV